MPTARKYPWNRRRLLQCRWQDRAHHPGQEPDEGGYGSARHRPREDHGGLLGHRELAWHESSATVHLAAPRGAGLWPFATAAENGRTGYRSSSTPWMRSRSSGSALASHGPRRRRRARDRPLGAGRAGVSPPPVNDPGKAAPDIPRHCAGYSLGWNTRAREPPVRILCHAAEGRREPFSGRGGGSRRRRPPRSTCPRPRRARPRGVESRPGRRISVMGQPLQ